MIPPNLLFSGASIAKDLVFKYWKHIVFGVVVLALAIAVRSHFNEYKEREQRIIALTAELQQKVQENHNLQEVNKQNVQELKQIQEQYKTIQDAFVRVAERNARTEKELLKIKRRLDELSVDDKSNVEVAIQEVDALRQKRAEELKINTEEVK